MKRILTAWLAGAALALYGIGTAASWGGSVTVGDLAPDFTLEQLSSEGSVQLYDHGGSIVLLDFFAYWCSHCNAAAADLEPNLVEYYRERGGNPDGLPVELIPISVDNRDPTAVEAFAAQYQLPVVLLDDGVAFPTYGDGFVPHLTLVSAAAGTNYDQWEILFSDAGYGARTLEQLRELIDSVQVAPELFPGDANQDLQFDQMDLFQVLRADKYLSGRPATWGEGDWDGAPGGSPGDPPAGDGVFDNLDLVAALQAGIWLTGPYAAEDRPVEVARAAGPVPAAVSEPSAASMLGLACLVLAAFAVQTRGRQRRALAAAAGVLCCSLAWIPVGLVEEVCAADGPGDAIDLFTIDSRAGDGPAAWEAFCEDADTDPDGIWQFDNGALILKAGPRGYVRTTSDFANFHLKLQWRRPEDKVPGRGGVLIRMTGHDKIWPTSLEAQLNAGSEGDFWGLDDYRLAGPSERFREVTSPEFGVLRNLKALREVAEKPPGRWNDYEIIADGETVTLKINGQLVNRAERCDVTAGRICLTAEGDEIHFRRVRLLPTDGT